MASKAYFQKLRDPKWQKKRLEILNRAKWKCEACGRDDHELQVHHTMYFYGREPWDIPSVFLRALCAECHPRDQVMDKIRQLLFAVAHSGTFPTEDRFDRMMGRGAYCAHKIAGDEGAKSLYQEIEKIARSAVGKGLRPSGVLTFVKPPQPPEYFI